MFQNRARAPNFEASGANSLFSAQAFLDCNKLACYHESWSTIGRKLNKMDVYMCDENCEKLIYIYIYLKKAKIRGKFHIQVLSRETPFNPFAAEALGVQG